MLNDVSINFICYNPMNCMVLLREIAFANKTLIFNCMHYSKNVEVYKFRSWYLFSVVQMSIVENQVKIPPMYEFPLSLLLDYEKPDIIRLCQLHTK